MKQWRKPIRKWLESLDNPGVVAVLTELLDNKKTTLEDFKTEAAKWDHPVPDDLLDKKSDDDRMPTFDYVQALEVLDTDPAWQGVLAYDEGREEMVYLKAPPTECGIAVEVSKDPMAVPEVVKEEHVTRIGTWFRKVKGVKVALRALEAASIANAKQTPFDWMRDRYFPSLPEWDEQERLETLMPKLFQAQNDDGMAGLFFKKQMIATAARTFEPGAKVDSVLMLVGGQGAGKTEGVSRLVPHIGLFSCVTGQPHGKDTIYQILGAKIVLLDELLKFNDIHAWKSFVTMRQDKQRLSYGRRAVTIPRRCVFWGSTNEEQFLTDVTGNRRYWPVQVLKNAQIDWQGIEDNRDQLWAEAKHRYEAEEKWWLSREQERKARKIQEHHTVEIPFTDELRELTAERLTIKSGAIVARDAVRVTSSCVWDRVGGDFAKRATAADLGTIRRAFQNLGFEQLPDPRVIIPGKKKKGRCWIPSQELYDELVEEVENGHQRPPKTSPEVVLDNMPDDVPDETFAIAGKTYRASDFADN